MSQNKNNGLLNGLNPFLTHTRPKPMTDDEILKTSSKPKTNSEKLSPGLFVKEVVTHSEIPAELQQPLAKSSQISDEIFKSLGQLSEGDSLEFTYKAKGSLFKNDVTAEVAATITRAGEGFDVTLAAKECESFGSKESKKKLTQKIEVKLEASAEGCATQAADLDFANAQEVAEVLQSPLKALDNINAFQLGAEVSGSLGAELKADSSADLQAELGGSISVTGGFRKKDFQGVDFILTTTVSAEGEGSTQGLSKLKDLGIDANFNGHVAATLQNEVIVPLPKDFSTTNFSTETLVQNVKDNLSQASTTSMFIVSVETQVQGNDTNFIQGKEYVYSKSVLLKDVFANDDQSALQTLTQNAELKMNEYSTTKIQSYEKSFHILGQGVSLKQNTNLKDVK